MIFLDKDTISQSSRVAFAAIASTQLYTLRNSSNFSTLYEKNNEEQNGTLGSVVLISNLYDDDDRPIETLTSNVTLEFTPTVDQVNL